MPKSFLGATGLNPQQVALFEDLVCAMMLHIRKQAESQLDGTIDQALCLLVGIFPAQTLEVNRPANHGLIDCAVQLTFRLH